MSTRDCRVLDMPMYPDDEPQPGWDQAVVDFDAKITTEDWVDFVIDKTRDYYKRRRLRDFIVGLMIFVGAFAIGGLFGGMSPSFSHSISPTAVFLTVFGFGLFAVQALGRYIFYDRLLRRRYRRWALREHGPEPLPFRGRLDASGYTASDVHGYVHRDWSAITSLGETDRQFFLTNHTGCALPIPKRDLAPAVQAQLRSFVLAHVLDSGAMPSVVVPSLSQDTIANATVLVRYRQTVQDRVATALLTSATPKGRNRRALAALAVVIAIASGIVVFDGLAWWLRWRTWIENWPVVIAILEFLREETACFSSRLLYAVGAGLALWAAWPWLLRQQLMAMAAPRGEMSVELAFGAAGIATSMPGTLSHHNWSEVRGVLEGSEHFGLLMPLSAILSIPKRSLGSSGAGALRSLLAEHVGRT